MFLETDPSLVLPLYDVTKENRGAAARRAHLIYGRADIREWKTCPFILRPDFVWIEQSVFGMPLSDAEELAERRRNLGAIVTRAPLVVDGLRFEGF